MKIGTTEKSPSSLENAIVCSLCYLYQEVLKEGLQELTDIMETTIQDCEEAICANLHISQDGKDALKQFHVLRAFRQLSQKQKDFFIREIESIRIER
jgi:hypothetical protein